MKVVIHKINKFAFCLAENYPPYREGVIPESLPYEVVEVEVPENIDIRFFSSLDSNKYKYENGQLIQANYKLTDEYKEKQILRIRIERDFKLTKTDWVLFSDSQANETCRQAFITYRQALRDLPNQENFDVDNFVWPTEPVYEK